ncbi:MAG: hypothetical protein P1U85_22610 [Verrucomicrobiales bacterium]|nr:hypothetical protein [Verrucomicrobiales bacterium]
MIYSAKYGSIFIRIPKAGSTSMSTYLLDSGLFNSKKDTMYLEANQDCYVDGMGTITLENLAPESSVVAPVANPKYSTHGQTKPITTSVHLSTQQVKRSFILENPRATEEEVNTFIVSRLGRNAILRRSAEASNIPITAKEALAPESINGKTLIEGPFGNVHATYAYLTQEKVIPVGTACFATIRNPIDRWVSMLNVTYSLEDIKTKGINALTEKALEGMNYIISNVGADRKAINDYFFTHPSPEGVTQLYFHQQHHYVPDDATLWPTEQLDSLITAFIQEKGGRVRANWQGRINQTKVGADVLSLENQQAVKTFYAKDLELWEAAIEKYA